MSAICTPSAECDDAQDAKQLFDIVSILCLFFFGIPLVIVGLRIIGNLADPILAESYKQLSLQTDIVYSVILAALTFLPMLYTYVRYERKLQRLSTAA
jgi:hypothetical protein